MNGFDVLDEQIKYAMKDLWRNKWVKSTILAITTLIGFYFMVMPLIQVYTGVTKGNPVFILFIVSLSGFLLFGWSVRQIKHFKHK